MKKQLFILITSFFFLSNYAQNEFLDYVVTKSNDTIYGKIKAKKNFGAIGKHYVSFLVNENTFDLIAKNGVIHKIKKRKIISFRYNDKKYFLDTLSVKSIFVKDKKTNKVNSVLNDETTRRFLFNKKVVTYNTEDHRLKDFIVNFKNDTVYGVFNKRRTRLKTTSNVKHIVNTKYVKSYRWNNNYYFRKKKSAVKIGDKKNVFLKVLINKGIKLYEYKIKERNQNRADIGSTIYYYLEIEGKLKYVPKSRFLKIMVQVLKKDKDLVKRIKKREFYYSNIYLLIKEYNARN